MLERILQVKVQDRELARKGRLLGIITLAAVVAVVGILVLFGIVNFLYEGSGMAGAGVIPTLTVIGMLIAWGVAKRGHVRPAIWLSIGVQYTGTAVAVVLFDGYRSAAQLNFIPQIISAGMLLGAQGAFWYGGAAGLLMLGVLMAEKIGVYSPLVLPLQGVRTLTYFGFTQISLFLTGFMAYIALRSLERASSRAEELVVELEKQRATLMERMAQRTADLERRAMYLEAVAQVARDAAAIRDIDSLLEATVRLVSDRFGFYHAGIFLVDEGGRYAVLRAASSEGGRRMLEKGHKLRVGEKGIVGYVAARGEPRIASEVGEDATFFDNPALPETRSEMALPLRVRGRVIGVLDVQSREPAAFSDEDVAVLQMLADQVAVAIENARLLTEAETRLRELDLLLGRRSEEGWRQIVGERQRWGYVYDGIDVVPREKVVGRPDVVPQLTVPLQVRGRAIGRLELVLGDRQVDPDVKALVEEVIEQAAVALESARMFQETQRALRETEALYRAGRAIGAAASAEEVEKALVEYASGSGADAAHVLRVEYDERGRPAYVVLGAGWRADGRSIQDFGLRMPLDEHPLAAFMQAGETVVVEDVLTDARANDASRAMIAVRLGMRSFVLVPITAGGRWIGELFAARRVPSVFPNDLIRGYEALAGQAGVALAGLRLLEETRRRAERERIISTISARMRATLDVETVLQTAAQEIGERLGLAELVVRVGVDEGVE